MKALTICQPYAELIVRGQQGLFDVEIEDLEIEHDQ